jgi:outer membrane biosynthesis protein TonB
MAALTRQPMRAMRSALLTVALFALGGALAGCESMENFQFWDTKKKLPGDRKPVFPEGVPGIEQGIPPELVKGYQEPQQPPDPAAQAAQETAEKADTKKVEAKPKPKPKPRTAAAPQQAQPAQQQPQPQQTQAPQQGWPGSQPQAQQQTGGWPSQR